MLDRSDSGVIASSGAAVGFVLSPMLDVYGLIFIGAVCGAVVSIAGRDTPGHFNAFKLLTRSILLSMLLTSVVAKAVASVLTAQFGVTWEPGELLMAVSGGIALYADALVERGRRKAEAGRIPTESDKETIHPSGEGMP